MRKPIYSWTSFFTRLGLKLVTKPVSQKAPRHRSLRLENLQAREMLTQTEWIIDNYPDNVTPQYVETGTGWYNYHDPARPVPYGDDSRWHGPASGVKATWTFANLPAGNYHVMATWEPRITFNPEAPYTIIQGTTTLGTVLVDQQFAPEQIDAVGVKWDNLAYVAITNETLKVELAAAEQWWYTSADAIRVESVETLLPPDLTIKMTNDPDAVLPGERFQIDYRYTVGNQGISGPFDIAYYYSTDPDLDEQEAVLLGVQTIPEGQGDLGFHNGKSPYFQINEVDEQGFFIHAKIDSTNAVAEGAGEGNNVGRMIHTVIVSPRPQWIVDTRDEGFQATGSWYAVVGYWYHVFGEQYYRWDVRNHGPSSSDDKSTWSKESLTSGQYEVLVTWGGGTASYDTTAQYTILDGATTIGTGTVDQHTRPGDQQGAEFGAGVFWKSLGTFTVAGSPPSDGHTLNVRLGCDAAKYVSGDAIWIIDMNPLLISALGLAADNGTSTTDYITSDPRVTGMVTGTIAQGNRAVVQFDHHANGSVDGTLDPVALNSTFTYDPRDSESPLPAGDQVLKYRVLEFNGNEEVRRGNWQEFRYTFLRPDLVFDAITADGTDLHDAVETAEWECLRAKKGLEYQITVGMLNGEDVTDYEQQFAEQDDIRDGNVANSSGEQMIALATTGRTRTNSIAVLKVGLARDVAQAADDLAGELKEWGTELANDHADADKQFALTVTGAAQTRGEKLAEADRGYTEKLAQANAKLASDTQDALSAERESRGLAYGDYQVALYQAHWDAMETVHLANPTDLSQYQFSVAEADFIWAGSVRTARNEYHDELTTAFETYTNLVNTANAEYVTAVAPADEAYAKSMAAAYASYYRDRANARADGVADLVKADLARGVKVVKAEGEYEVDLARAEQAFHNKRADADVRRRKTINYRIPVLLCGWIS